MPVERICGCGIDFHQHLIVLRGRFVDLCKLKNIGRSVVCVDNCFHANASTFALLGHCRKCPKPSSNATAKNRCGAASGWVVLLHLSPEAVLFRTCCMVGSLP